MPRQAVKAAKSRLARFEAKKVYSFESSRSGQISPRAGVYKIGA